MMDSSLSELQDESLGSLNDKDLPLVEMLPSSTATYSLPQNCLSIVLVDASSRPLQLTTAVSDINHVNYNSNGFIELPARTQPTITIPGIFQQATEIDEESVGAVYQGEVCGNLTSDTLLHQADLTVSSPLTDSSQSQDVKKNDKPLKKKGGWPKGKRRKEVPALEVTPPKPPPTGYLLYAITRRSEIKLEHPELIFPEVTKMLGYEWTNLDPVKKQKYLDEAEDLHKQYQEKLKAFNESEAYKNMIQKRKKLNENGVVDNESSTKDQIEADTNNLHCDICDMYFTSSHNKREHLFGRLHLQNVSREISRQEQSKQLEAEEQQRLGDLDCEQADEPLDIQGFINSFRAQNHERQHELTRLKQTVKLAREENNSLYKQITELKNYENRLNAELESSKQIGQNIINHVETLKIITSSFSAIFGLLNYDV